MAASPDGGYPTAEAQIGGQDSTAQTDTIPKPAIPQPMADNAVSGEKRKRAEGEEADCPPNPLWKTSLCSYFRRTGGSCSHGSTCRYAHGEEELRKRPDGSWDPTSERGKEASGVTKREVAGDDENDEDNGVTDGASKKKLKQDWVTSGTDTNGDASDLGDRCAKSARDVVTPYANFSYSDQLQFKRSSLEKILKKLTRNARKVCPTGALFPQWIMKSKESAGLACKLEDIVASPLVNGYRNKCEFTIGLSTEGKPTIGFTLGTFKAGVTAVAEPVDCPNVSSIAIKYASIFQEFLQNSSLPVWCRHKNTGFCRQFTVCSLGHDNDVISSEFEKMAYAFSTEAAASSPMLPLTHLVIQEHQGISNVASYDAPLRSLLFPKPDCGPVTEPVSETEEPRIHDYINDLKFSISPTAFFQVNTLAAEKLYSLAGDWAGLDGDTLLFDVCCGTGTIGLTLAHRVGMVVGIEVNASAVSDAHRNAEINGIKNCRFVCGKAEDVMGSLLKEYLDVPQKQDGSSNAAEKSLEEQESGNQENSSLNMGVAFCRLFKSVVAVVDPPRSGLHPTVIKALRTHSGLRKLVYISCNPDTLTANAIELCSNCPEEDKGKKDNRGWRNMSSAGLARRRVKSMPKSEPFWPVKAMGFDLFPHTSHCEMVMLMER
ncbi:hypothetical protein SAY86_019278 [Trapa natans]|uniref:C3H1-type domain-containing protein n=1 Tax=Trapa natans TaxID=22666 RepID=A0AAN7LMW3_TRANT|nr:hypothetical protein SAY86_019278 [Trapa natans]